MRSPFPGRSRSLLRPARERYCSGADRAVKEAVSVSSFARPRRISGRARPAATGNFRRRIGDSPSGTQRGSTSIVVVRLGNRTHESVANGSRGGAAMWTRWAGAAVAAAALGLGTGSSLAAPPAPTNEYTIGPEDILDVTVWNNAGLSRTVPVRPDGKISLPLLDDVQAAGVTPKQLKADLTRRLAKFIASPEVSVIVREIRSRKVAVLGEVRKPGRYDVGSRASVLDAIALAGGFNDFARRSKMVILRVEGSTVTRIPCDYDKVVSDGQLETFLLRPGDTLIVP